MVEKLCQGTYNTLGRGLVNWGSVLVEFMEVLDKLQYKKSIFNNINKLLILI